jgi:hypothetical protein
MVQLVTLMRSGEIGAVACIDEDRLFRDLTQLQVNRFIQICEEHDVHIITPGMIYDFRNESTRRFHRRQFRFKSEEAAEIIYSIQQGRLYAARQREVQQGRWLGGRPPIGFMIDQRKHLPEGHPNPDWRKLSPFPPYAGVVKSCFEVFLQQGKTLAAAAKQLQRHGPFFPNYDSVIVQQQIPSGFQLYRPRFQQNDAGDYYLTYSGLGYLLTNAIYLGHYIYRNRLERRDNHPAIVPTALFFDVFNALSETTLTGEPNPAYQPVRLRSRSPQIRALCQDLIVVPTDHGEVRARMVWDCLQQSFVYRATRTRDRYFCQKSAAHLDPVVTRHFQSRLQATLEQAHPDPARPGAHAASSVLPEKGLDTDLHHEGALEQQPLLKAAAETDLPLKIPQSLLLRFQDYLDQWERLSLEQQHATLRAFVAKIVVEGQGKVMMHLQIFWKDSVVTEETLPLCGTTYRAWLPGEVDLIRALVAANAGQLALMAVVPQRKWASIREMIRKFLGSRISVSPKWAFDDETYETYLERSSGGSNPHQAQCGHRWIESERVTLRLLVERQATKLDLLEAFPYRTWSSIDRMIRRVVATPVPIAGNLPFARSISLNVYRNRSAPAAQASRGDGVKDRASPDVNRLPPFHIPRLFQQGGDF